MRKPPSLLGTDLQSVAAQDHLQSCSYLQTNAFISNPHKPIGSPEWPLVELSVVCRQDLVGWGGVRYCLGTPNPGRKFSPHCINDIFLKPIPMRLGKWGHNKPAALLQAPMLQRSQSSVWKEEKVSAVWL